MEDCGKCLKSFTKTGVKTKMGCYDCKQSYHAKCINFTPEDIQFYKDSDEIWRCEVCSKERRKSMVLESRPGSSVTYDDIYNLVLDLRKDIKDTETSLNKSIELCFEELKDTKNIVRKQSEEVASLVELVNTLRTENTELKRKVASMECRMDEIEQYSRRETIEIHGVPVKPGEQVVEVVKSVGRALDLTIENSMISACHRLRGRDGRPPGIIVKMTSRMDAEAVLQKRRVKRNFSTHHIGLTASPASPIYINESLCPGRRRLLNAAREKKKEKHYTYLWIRNGKILMRKADGEQVRVVTNFEDLDKL